MRLEITDKFLIVRGIRQKYAIHFGSGNIQILPQNRYLCIVPNRTPREAQGLKLPFAGDTLLSIILAKAFLLADERQITDQTIWVSFNLPSVTRPAPPPRWRRCRSCPCPSWR